MVVNCKPVLFENGIKPVYKTKEAACADLAVPDQVTIPPHTTVCIDLKVGFEIANGFKIIMYPRSSLLVKKNLVQPTSIIDSDYSGQRVHAPLHNLGDEPVTLAAGERVCQIECVPTTDCFNWEHERTERNKVNGGFGSTGEH